MMSTLMGRDDDGRDLFSNLQREVERVFGDYRPLSPTGGRTANGESLLMPRVDVSETDSEIAVEAELPGVERDDVDVQVLDNVLVIEGNKKTESEKKDKNYHVVERSSGQFVRRIPLGFEVDADKVEATFRNGVLNVTISKPPEAETKAKRIEIRETEAA